MIADDDSPDAVTGEIVSEYSAVALGKLRLKPTDDAEVAEQLLRQKLLPAAQGVDGLRITDLKKTVALVGGRNRDTQPDFIMMGELKSVTSFLNLMASTPGKLKEYGDQMKIQAGAPEFELYEVLGTSAP